MRQVERELDRYLTLLRNKIREGGFTQLEVQEALGWGRSYISQLVTKTKALRVEQVLLILNVVGADPAEFFAELYGLSRSSTAWSKERARRSVEHGEDVAPAQDFEKFKALLQGVTGLLIERRIIEASDLKAAVEAEDRKD